MTSKELIARIESMVASTDDFESDLMTRLSSGGFENDCATYHALKRGISNAANVAYEAFKSYSDFEAWREKLQSLPKLTAVYYGRYPILKKELPR